MSDPAIYSKSKWHYESDQYPSELPLENAHIHSGFFLAWLFDNAMVSQLLLAEHATAFERYQQGNITPGQLFALIGETLDEQMLTAEGNEFTKEYFDEFYLDDYWLEFEDEYESFFLVEDNVQNFQQIVSVLDQAYLDWQAEQES